jgi:signal peptidase I
MKIGGLDNMKEKKKLKPIHIIIDVLFFGVIGFMVMCFTWNFIDIRSGYKYPLFGQRATVIVPPSMASVNDANKDYITEDMKQIQKYDVITTKDYKSFDEVQIYDIATYYTGKELICHRVIKKYESDGKQYIIFRGDANNVDDTPVSFELLRGKVTKITPKVGHVVAFFQSPYLFIALFGTLFFVFLGMFIITYKKDKKEPVKEENVPNEVNDKKDEEKPLEEAKNEEINNEEQTPQDNKE